jgi:acetyl esterase/lipase
MKRWFSALALIGTTFLVVPALAADTPLVVKLWPGKAPGDTGGIGEEKMESKPGDKVQRLTNVSIPTITVTRPAKDKDTGAAVVIAPGGGYSILAWTHEGEDVATWLNSIGVTAVLLKYRVPRRPDDPKDKPPVGALMDAQRAIGLVRNNAKEWGIDPKRIGFLGFSAGGHLTGWASTNYEKRAYDPIDDADKVSCRPDFAVLIYPGGLIVKDKDELSPEIKVTKDTPPSFLAHAGDDKAENSVRYYLALRKEGVKAEMHIYASGGHGFGMIKKNHPSDEWTQQCAEWMRDQGFLKKE